MDFKKKINLENGLQIKGVDGTLGQAPVIDGSGDLVWGATSPTGYRLVSFTQADNAGDGSITISTANQGLAGATITQPLLTGDIVEVTGKFVINVVTESTGVRTIIGRIRADGVDVGNGTVRFSARNRGQKTASVTGFYTATADSSVTFQDVLSMNSVDGSTVNTVNTCQITIKVYRQG